MNGGDIARRAKRAGKSFNSIPKRCARYAAGESKPAFARLRVCQWRARVLVWRGEASASHRRRIKTHLEPAASPGAALVEHLEVSRGLARHDEAMIARMSDGDDLRAGDQYHVTPVFMLKHCLYLS